jgi:hypothetical protein
VFSRVAHVETLPEALRRPNAASSRARTR